MKLRYKLLLAQLPLAVALLALGFSSLSTVGALGRSSKRILADNYRTVLAMQRIKESVERLDSAALFLVAGHRQRGIAQVPSNRATFEAELKAQEGNITEPGEQELTAHLRTAWTRYQQVLDRLLGQTERTESERTYFDELAPAFQEVKKQADEILALNQDSMIRKGDDARRLAQKVNGLLSGLLFVALLLGVLASAWLTRRLLRPLDGLVEAARRIGEGELGTRAAAVGKDEIAAVASEFNQMAESLGRFRKSSLGELLQAQQASQAAIDSLPDPVLVLNVEGNVVSVNEAGETLLGLSKVTPGQSPLAHADPAARDAIERARSHVLGGKGAYAPHGFDQAVRFASAEGERYLLARATPLYAEEGIAGVTVVLQDVTRLRRFDELKNDLVSTVAHEFRTPLTSLHMAIHLCMEQAAGPLTDKQADLLHAAREDCERLQGIVNDLLDLARLQAGKMELHRAPTSVDAVVQAALGTYQIQARQKGIALESEVTPSLPEVLVDAERLQLVFGNLLGNALRYTPSGGEVTIRAIPADGGVRFEVSDTGPGIAPEHQERVFERFFRVPGTVAEGAGLGLFITKEIVQAHGGEIGVTSQLGEGSTFWFCLPSAARPREAPVSS